MAWLTGELALAGGSDSIILVLFAFEALLTCPAYRRTFLFRDKPRPGLIETMIDFRLLENPFWAIKPG
jgi:hypothetical protein